MLDARQSSFYSYTHFEEGEFSVQIQKKYLKRPLVGTVRKRPFHHRGLYSNHHLASCRHLRYIKLFPHSHHLPWGSYGSANSTRGGLDASPMEIKCIKLCRYVIILWSSQLDCITIVCVYSHAHSYPINSKMGIISVCLLNYKWWLIWKLSF